MEKIPIREGLFSERISGHLMGLKCKLCNHFLPPLTTICCYCNGVEFENVKLSQQGKLYSYTIIYQPHKHFEVPFSVGYVDLPEGIRIFAPLKKKGNMPFRIGMPMRLLVDKLWDDNESEIIGPKFEPM